MLGCKVKDMKHYVSVSLDDLVPQDNFYRRLEGKLDLEFVRELVRAHYCSQRGRPSIDPVVFFKLQLIMFFEGIRSERRLMEMVNLNLAHRWYIGYDLNESVPDHSSLSKIRTRYGLSVFQCFFEKIIERCVEVGLVWGQELYFDGSQVQANASIDSLTDRLRLHLVTQFNPTDEVPKQSPGSVEHLSERYQGKRVAGRERTSSYRRVTDERVSTTDADATPMKLGLAGFSQLGYRTHYVVDGGKARIILAALVTPASIMDNTPMLDLARWVRFRWSLQPRVAVADSKYGTLHNLAGLEQDGIRAFIPLHSQERQKHERLYSSDLFTYDAQENHYVCPQGQILEFKHPVRTTEVWIYQAKKRVCDACPVQTLCRTGKYGRSVSRSFFQDIADRVRAYQTSAAFRRALRKRQVWIEPLFGEGKQWHGMTRCRLRGLANELIQAFGANR